MHTVFQLDEKFPTDDGEVWPTSEPDRYFRTSLTHTWNLEEFCFEIKEKKINYNVIKISFRDRAL